jgi:hypothetical protein
MKELSSDPQVSPRNPNGNQRPGRLPERTQEAAERAGHAAIEKVENVRDRTRDGINQGKQQVADRIRRLSSALRSASETLREDDKVVARYADYASEAIEKAAGYVSSAEVARTVQDVERFARRQPALFFGGAFLLGLAAGRFLKSSRHRNADGGPEYQAADYSDRDSSERITATNWPAPPRRRTVPASGTEGVFDTRTRSVATGAPPGVSAESVGSRPTEPGSTAGQPSNQPIAGSVPSVSNEPGSRRGST